MAKIGVHERRQQPSPWTEARLGCEILNDGRTICIEEAVNVEGPDVLPLTLRNVTEEDLPTFFEHQRDAVALRMAGFQSRERDAFLIHWRTNVLRPGNLSRTIVHDRLVAGYVGSWTQDGKRLVAYWLGREHWGKGIGTGALAKFLALEPIRPLHAWVAVHNAGSIRVLEKCGFRRVAEEHPPTSDGTAEVLLRLDRR